MNKIKTLGSLLGFLVPGLGNLYARNIKKAIIIYLGFFLSTLSLRFFAYDFVLLSTLVVVVIGICLYSVVSGYRDVKNEVTYKAAAFDRWYTYAGIVVLHLIIFTIMRSRALEDATPINFARIVSPAMDPALQVGDVMAFQKTKSLGRNDVTVFWFPDDVKTMYVKRCIALPGDTLQINNGNVSINRSQLKEHGLKYKYMIITDGSAINARVFSRYGIGDDYYQISSDSYQCYLTQVQAKQLESLSFVKSVTLSLSKEGSTDGYVYPASERFTWNADFYGPIYLPKKGDRIQLTDLNADLYFKCMQFENASVKREAGRVILDGREITEYQFQDNYYFMMGDSRHNSLDSRYWGLLPESLVIGKALYLYWGRNFERVGKSVQ